MDRGGVELTTIDRVAGRIPYQRALRASAGSWFVTSNVRMSALVAVETVEWSRNCCDREARHPTRVEHALRDRRHARDVGLRLRDSVGLEVDPGRLRPRQLVREVLRAEQNLRRRPVELLLVQREQHRRKRDKNDRLQDDPLPPTDYLQVVAQRCRMTGVPSCHSISPSLDRGPHVPEGTYCDVSKEPSIGPWSYLDRGTSPEVSAS